jgi:signal transduction histidine kinase/HPt (histidine-containing phosphotransfer) domain-containing protein/ActR/RegA family two-component response regulator
MVEPLPQFLCELGFALLEHRGHGSFALLSPPPQWLTELWELSQGSYAEIPVTEKSPFLENFMSEADAFWNSSREGLFQSETWVEKSPSGREIPLEAIALQLEGKRVLALHSPEPQFQERTKLLQTARESLLEHERLQREIQKKEILLHCIIHDLSQPLSVMSVAFDCMDGEKVSEKGKELLELGRKASEQQMEMIRDILQVFSADLKATLDAEARNSGPDLFVCASSALNAFIPVFAAKKVRLEFEKPQYAEGKWWVRGEATRIERIFSNLLENALRYTPAGSRVLIGLDEDNDFVRAWVDDEGPGLPPDMSQSQIFALFSKGKEGGGKAGLGLYFCRLTVERWGGKIGCQSLPQKGSRFWFQLPRLTGQPEPVLATAPPTKVHSREAPTQAPLKEAPMRILLAEDQNEIRLLTRHQLERKGHHVVAVANGKLALDALEREPFDVLLLDEDMPVMSGPQVLHAIRERRKESPPMMVIALTGYNSDPDRERLLKAGFDSVIGKPFRLDALESLLYRSSRSAAALDAHKESEIRPAQSFFANLLERIGGDEKLARKLISTFLRDTPQRMDGLQKALKRKNAESLASLAHALKGSISIFGAVEAYDCALKLQDQGRANDLHGLSQVYDQLKEEIAKLEANLRGYAQKRSPSPGANPEKKRRSFNPNR